MYCVKCGVELADSEKKCPLCGTPVFHPDIPRNLSEPPFPPDKRIRPEDVNRSGVLFVLTIAALLPALLCLLCDWRINGTLVWSGYAAGAIALLYVVILLPMWFRRPNPVIFVPVDFIAVGLYLQAPARIPAPEILPVRQQENKNRHSEKHAWTRLGSCVFT